MTKDYVRLEIATALARKVRVVPVLVDDAQMPAESELPLELVRAPAMNLRWPDLVGGR